MQPSSSREVDQTRLSRPGLPLANTQHCSDWTYNDSDQAGWIADCTATDARWTRGAENHRGTFAAIDCVEQP